MTYVWKKVETKRLAPAPYDDDHVLVEGVVEAVVRVNQNTVCFDVYPEPQRPTDPVTGTIYGRVLVAGHYLDYDKTQEGRARAIAEAKALCEKAIDMLRADVCYETIYREVGSQAWWDAWRKREYGT